MALSATEVSNMKHAPKVEGVLPAIQERWSARAFSSREVSKQDLHRIFEAARWAPSSNNEQPWRYVVGLRGTSTHEKIHESLMGFNQAWAPKAPVLMVGLAKAKMGHNGASNLFAFHDLGAASAYLVLQAAALGMTTHQMGGVDREKARTLLEIPEDYQIGAAIALGYQDEPETLGNEELIKRELAPRNRKPLEEIVFSAWGEPLKLS
ncbi:MAG TPA: nitroreductase family protein [Terracidiphilus sp.]|nr:nitroreductase family protein [Terracidiphilus sp.]